MPAAKKIVGTNMMAMTRKRSDGAININSVKSVHFTRG
jgi:hypothetical protein